MARNHVAIDGSEQHDLSDTDLKRRARYFGHPLTITFEKLKDKPYLHCSMTSAY